MHTNGEWMSANNNSSSETGGSLTGGNIDLIAPGSDSIVYTTTSSNSLDNNSYGQFNGSSAACPHVTGAVALALSYYNKPCYSNYNLSHEDMEQLLQKSATDVDSLGYDTRSGWGRLNVRALLDSIKKDDYQIIHPQNNYISYHIVLEDTIEVGGKNLEDYGPYGNEGLAILIENQSYTYLTERYKITTTYNFSNYLINPTTKLLDAWPRKNTSTFSVFILGGFSGFPPIIEKFNIEHNVELVTFTDSTITLSGYLYHFIEEKVNSITTSYPNVWYPSDTTNFRFDYSIYLQDTVNSLNFDFPCDSTNFLVDSLATVKIFDNNVNIYPNPVNNYTYVRSSTPIDKIIIYDLSGKLLFKKKNNLSVLTQKINLTQFSNGVYFVSITTESDDIITKKIIKQ